MIPQMSTSPSESPAGEPRAAITELARSECLELLARNHFGRVAVAIGDGPPAIRPVNYVFDQRSQSVAFQTAGGSKLLGVLKSKNAAFEIDAIDATQHAGWSVVIHGVAEEVTDPSELVRLGELGLDPWVPGFKSHWVRIRAYVVSGRRLGPPAAVPRPSA
jgi:nitroimidazol reductase NimA-like FMN-containing flavoprotein (pyridoxamine 5'-phosphate oxidase superfamily)